MQDANGKIITSSEAPEGHQYLQVTGRKNKQANVEQLLILPEDFDPDSLIEFRYWAKFNYATENDRPNDKEARHNNFFTKLTVQHYIDEKSESYTLQVSLS